jgi:hypothetical protein
MPNHEEHCLHSLKRYGVRGDDIHTWIDEPSYLFGSSHRDERHDPKRDMPIVIRMFGQKYGYDVAWHIFLDHVLLDRQESNLKLPQNEPAEPLAQRLVLTRPQPTRPLTRRDIYLFIGCFGVMLSLFSLSGSFPWNFTEDILGGIVGFVIIGIAALLHYRDKKRSERIKFW